MPHQPNDLIHARLDGLPASGARVRSTIMMVDGPIIVYSSLIDVGDARYFTRIEAEEGDVLTYIEAEADLCEVRATAEIVIASRLRPL